MKRRIVLLGPPASGKGTIADRLHAEFDLPIASPGAMLREEKAAGTALGHEADRQTSLGQLVGDDTINAVVGHWLDRQNGDAMVFDGYPRTLGQAGALEQMLAARQTPLEITLFLEAGLDTLRQRVEHRAQCSACRHIVSLGVHVATLEERCPRCGGVLIRRKDDNAETLEQRFAEYAAKTAPLIGYYEQRQLLHRVDTERPSGEVFASVRQLLL